MNKLFTRFYAYKPPEDWQSQKRPVTTDGWHSLDLPGTRMWYPSRISPGIKAPPNSNQRRDSMARLGWPFRAARYVALAAFVVAGGAALATYQRSLNHDA